MTGTLPPPPETRVPAAEVPGLSGLLTVVVGVVVVSFVAVLAGDNAQDRGGEHLGFACGVNARGGAAVRGL